jgi:glycosyltransferase involved in cell wall biosynthesis
MTRRKRIVVCTSQTPFVRGGAEILAESLTRELSRRNWLVDLIRIPFRWYPNQEILKSYMMWRLIDLTEAEGQPIDLVITTRFPSFAAYHPNKVTWLVQQFRQAYDLFGTKNSHLTDSAEDTRLRQLIQQIDTQTLTESQRLFAISRNVAQRLYRYNGLQTTPLYPPPQHEGRYRNDGYGDYVLSVSRLNQLKRVDMIIKAMAYVRTSAQLLIAGEGSEQERLQELARKGASDRIKFLGFVDDDKLLDLYANCLAVFYAPMDEDYGLATVEAFKSQKPVLTALDSGGVLEFVEEEVTGYIVSPNQPKQLAERIDQLYLERALCRQLGEAGFEKVRCITWETTISHLLDEQI